MRRTPAAFALLALAATGCASVPGTDPQIAAGTSAVVTAATVEPVTRPCASAEGFSVMYPANWTTNSGAVVERCTFFGPRPFRVGAGPRLRPAPLRVAVEPAGFALATKAHPGEQQRAGTVIAGRRAVRIVRLATDGDLWPTGTRIVSYFVDLAGPPPLRDPGLTGTLVLDLVGLPDFDVPTARRVLDRMATSVRLGDEAPQSVVARYRIGLTSVVVRAHPNESGVCLSRPPSPPPRCFANPDPDRLAYAGLVVRQAPALVGGVAGAKVFRVVVHRRSRPGLEVLPVAIAPGAATRAWAVPAAVGRVTGVAWYDAEGRRLGELPARDLPGEPSAPSSRPSV